MTAGRIKKFFSWSLGPAGVLTTVLLTAGVTAAATSYINFVQHSRAVVEADFGKLKDSSVEFLQLLNSYSRLARLGTPVDQPTQERFAQTTLKLYQQADALRQREPGLAPDFERFRRSLLALQAAASAMTGPLDAQKFVEAVSEYIAADRQFKSKITDQQRRFLVSLFQG